MFDLMSEITFHERLQAWHEILDIVPSVEVLSCRSCFCSLLLMRLADPSVMGAAAAWLGCPAGSRSASRCMPSSESAESLEGLAGRRYKRRLV